MDIPNLWGNFDILDINSPKEILDQQAKFLTKLTGDIIFAEVIELETGELYDAFEEDGYNGFSYKFVLKSKFMDRYKFEMLKFHHDIVLYPTIIKLDHDIQKELGINGRYKKVSSETEFMNFISEVFKTSRIKNVVGAMLKLSK
ncbi:hypothetical protein M3599_15325 [Niallia circulans]|uniref:hypothetical protein n=1 Tax=Niallia circulans TaxID=1397 RepID=UPI00203AA558|nr:hypothetical protein [Niallia circulans]MCM2982296.1 hypothetical protein [Niallia circulans]